MPSWKPTGCRRPLVLGERAARHVVLVGNAAPAGLHRCGNASPTHDGPRASDRRRRAGLGPHDGANEGRSVHFRQCSSLGTDDTDRAGPRGAGPCLLDSPAGIEPTSSPSRGRSALPLELWRGPYSHSTMRQFSTPFRVQHVRVFATIRRPWAGCRCPRVHPVWVRQGSHPGLLPLATGDPPVRPTRAAPE